MSTFEQRLASLTSEPPVAKLEGPGGLLAIGAKDLWLITPDQEQYTSLVQIKRITKGEGGQVVVLGESDTLMQIPLRAFQVEELKLFLESLRMHISRAKKSGGSATLAASEPPQPPPPPPATSRPTLTPQMWEEDSPAPVTTQVWTEPAANPSPRKTAEDLPSPTQPPALASQGRTGGQRSSLLSNPILLKALGLLSLVIGLVYIVTDSSANLVLLLWIAISSVGLGVLLWSQSETS